MRISKLGLIAIFLVLSTPQPGQAQQPEGTGDSAGTVFEFEIDLEQGVADALLRFAKDMEYDATRFGQELTVESVDGTSIHLNAPAEAGPDLEEYFYYYPLIWHDEADGLRLEPEPSWVLSSHSYFMSLILSATRERLTGTGLLATVTQAGDNGMTVEIAGLPSEQHDEVTHLITATGRFQLRGVYRGNALYWPTVVDLLPAGGSLEFNLGHIEASTLSEARQFADLLAHLEPDSPYALPETAVVAFDEMPGFDSAGELSEDETRYRLILVDREVAMNGLWPEDTDIQVDSDDVGMPFVMIELGVEDQQRVCEITTNYMALQLAIMLDDVVLSAPIVEERICGGRLRISLGFRGSFDVLNAEALALVGLLRGGAHPAPVELIRVTQP